MLQSVGSQRVGHNLATEQLNYSHPSRHPCPSLPLKVFCSALEPQGPVDVHTFLLEPVIMTEFIIYKHYNVYSEHGLLS